VIEAGGGDLGRHLSGAGLGAGVADGGAVVDPAFPGDGAGDEEQALHEHGLAGAVRPDECDVPDLLLGCHVSPQIACRASGFMAAAGDRGSLPWPWSKATENAVPPAAALGVAGAHPGRRSSRPALIPGCRRAAMRDCAALPFG